MKNLATILIFETSAIRLWKIILMGICLLRCSSLLFAQSGLQNLRGVVKDKESEVALSYVSVGLFKDTFLVASIQTNEQGNFEYKDIAPGRYSLKAYITGYKPAQVGEVIVNSGKETIVDILMEEEFRHLNEITVNSSSQNAPVNEMILTGGRVFSVEETNRYAGSRGDPARMAASFAGTQSTDDSRNDLVIRGNSPLGLLWRIQDVDVPNPNHFAIPGTTGGAISILNNKMFNNSDFLIGAFPAEYGNSNAGVFDIKLRNGNNERHEGTVQFGFLGTELALEGPLSGKENATYLVTYRYSTLQLFQALNIKIGTDAVPNYQDASFKLNFPFKNDDQLSLFGIWGKSKIDIILSQYDSPPTEIYGENNKDQYFNSSTGLLGISYFKSFRRNLFFKGTISHTSGAAGEEDFTIYRNMDYQVDSLVRSLGYTFKNDKNAIALNLLLKKDSRNLFNAGLHLDFLHYDLIDSIYDPAKYIFIHRLDSKENTILVQGYIQWKFKWNPNLEMNSGIHLQNYALNGQTVFEPRLGIRWSFADHQVISAGIGLHSQLQPYYIYFYQSPDAAGHIEQQNRNLGFSRSFHSTVAYEVSLSDKIRLKLEGYYIWLYDIPISSTELSSYSVINEGAEFGRFFPGPLTNHGTGFNTGVECTVEKSFSSGYYFLFTSSLFDSKYKGSDGVLRSSSFNGIFSMNGLAGKEFSISRKHNEIISIGSKITYAGGRRYSPPDISASNERGELVIIDSLRNSEQFKNYFRVDLKLGYKINSKKLTHEFGIDLVNLFNIKNTLELIYSPDPRNPDDNPIKTENQLGFLPLFYYKMDFTLKRK